MNNELSLRHMTDIQGIIGRLSQHSFVIRGWSVTLVSVVFAIIADRAQSSASLLTVALVPTVIFWGLDAYYLRQERLFRELYAAVARGLSGDGRPVEPFDMSLDPYRDRVASLPRTLLVPHVLAVPLLLSFLVVVYMLAN